MKQVFTLVHSEARQRAASAVMHAMDGYRVVISEPPRTSDQNAKLHSVLQEISVTREWAGRKWSVEQWKRLLTAAWMRAKGQSAHVVPALDGGGFDVLYRHTSEMSKPEMVDLIEYILAWQQVGEAA